MNEIKEILEKYPDYRNALFRRGYLITTNSSIHKPDEGGVPFL